MHKTIVVIDDDQDDLDIMKESLSQIDSTIDCICFDLADDAIRRLSKEQTFHPDCIFVDLNMPKIGGAECLKLLRNIVQLNDIPIIICSTSMSPGVSDNLMKRGATYTFQKPYSVGEYLSILKSVMSLCFDPRSHRDITEDQIA